MSWGWAVAAFLAGFMSCLWWAGNALEICECGKFRDKRKGSTEGRGGAAV